MILFLLTFLGFSAYLTLVLRASLLNVPYYFCTVTVVWLYAFGLFGFMEIGFNLFFIGCLFSGLYALYKERLLINLDRSIKFSYLGFLIPYVYLFIIIPDNFQFTSWDEFSFWARSIKVIFDSDSLFLSDSPITLKHYPPAQQIFQYYFLKFSGWSEKNVLWAQEIFIFSCILYISNAFINNSLNKLFLFYSSCIFIYFFTFSFTCIYSDVLLSVYFAACFLSVVRINKSFFDYLFIFLSAICLTLIKEIGLLLSLIVWISFVFSQNFHKKSKINNLFDLIRNYLPCFFQIISILITYKSWHLYLNSIGVSKSHSLAPLYDIIFGQGKERLIATSNEFISRINSSSFFIINNHYQIMSLSIVSMSFILLSLGTISVILIDSQGSKKETLGQNLLLFIGFYAYILFLFLTYLAFFSEYEGVRLASFERYVSTYVMGWLFVVFSYLLSAIEKRNVLSSICVAVSLFFFSVLLSPSQFKSDITGIIPNNELVIKRMNVTRLADGIKQHIKTGERAYFIMQNSTGYEKNIFDYVMLPYSTADWCWSLGSKYYDGDVWTCNKKMRELIEGFQYIALYDADEQFWQDNELLFALGDRRKKNGIFKILRNGNNIDSIISIP